LTALVPVASHSAPTDPSSPGLVQPDEAPLHGGRPPQFLHRGGEHTRHVERLANARRHGSQERAAFRALLLGLEQSRVLYPDRSHGGHARDERLVLVREGEDSGRFAEIERSDEIAAMLHGDPEKCRHGDVFVGEPHGSRMIRDVVGADGLAFRQDQSQEALAAREMRKHVHLLRAEAAMEKRIEVAIRGQSERRSVSCSGELHRPLDDGHEHLLDVEALRELKADIEKGPQ
jgi:hypothetical protein